MKRNIILSMVCFFLYGCGDRENQSFTDWNNHEYINANRNSLLQFDGVYVEKKAFAKSIADEDKDLIYFSHYLRFFPDSTLLAVSSSGDPYQIRLWFNKSCENCSKGNFHLQNDRLEFVSNSSQGTVKYKGSINEKGELLLNVSSLINGHESETTYEFMRLSHFNR